MSSQSQDTFELPGSCHCGQVTFTARNVGFGGIHKCNCAWCIKVGLLHVDIGPQNILLLPYGSAPDGSSLPAIPLTWQTPIPEGYTSKLAFYMSGGEKSKIRWYSCTNCHIFLFTCGDYGSAKEGRCSVSLRCVDLQGTGETLTSLTKAERLEYLDAAHEIGQCRNPRKGEPYEPGEW